LEYQQHRFQNKTQNRALVNKQKEKFDTSYTTAVRDVGKFRAKRRWHPCNNQ